MSETFGRAVARSLVYVALPTLSEFLNFRGQARPMKILKDFGAPPQTDLWFTFFESE